MKKGIISIVMIAVLSLVVAGCGGGGGSSSSSGGGAVTSTFHVQDGSNHAMAGVVFNYTDPSGIARVTNASDTNGNITVVSNQVGTYNINSMNYNNASYNFSQPAQMQNTAADISNNAKVAYNVTVIMQGQGAIITCRPTLTL